MKILTLMILVAAILPRLHADSAISSAHHQPITVWLAEFDKEGYTTKLQELGTGKRVVVSSNVISRFRGNVARASFPAVGLVVECTPMIKLKNGGETNGRVECQIDDGYVVSYNLNPDTGVVGMTFRFGIYP